MKANTMIALKKVIAEMVSKEVAKQIHVVVQEIVNPNPTSTVEKPVTEKIKVKDPILNKILNETQGGLPTDATEPYPTMGGGAYTTDRAGEIAIGNMGSTQSMSDMPEFMKKAMSGHSAKVVKAIETKKGTKR